MDGSTLHKCDSGGGDTDHATCMVVTQDKDPY